MRTKKQNRYQIGWNIGPRPFRNIFDISSVGQALFRGNWGAGQNAQYQQDININIEDLVKVIYDKQNVIKDIEVAKQQAREEISLIKGISKNKIDSLNEEINNLNIEKIISGKELMKEKVFRMEEEGMKKVIEIENKILSTNNLLLKSKLSEILDKDFDEDLLKYINYQVESYAKNPFIQDDKIITIYNVNENKLLNAEDSGTLIGNLNIDINNIVRNVTPYTEKSGMGPDYSYNVTQSGNDLLVTLYFNNTFYKYFIHIYDVGSEINVDREVEIIKNGVIKDIINNILKNKK